MSRNCLLVPGAIIVRVIPKFIPAFSNTVTQVSVISMTLKFLSPIRKLSTSNVKDVVDD